MANIKKFLDATGVSVLWNNIKTELNKKVSNTDLSTIATSGSASDVSITDSGNYYEGTNVENVLQEIGNELNITGAVTLTESAGSNNVLKVYTLSQRGNIIGTINIPKDLVAVSGEIVDSDGTNNGTFLKLNIANGDPVYINVASLLEGLETKADKNNTILTGTISHGRVNNTTIGNDSIALGHNVIASNDYSFAEGQGTTASGVAAHAEGYYTNAAGSYSHVVGMYNIEDNFDNIAEWTPGQSYYFGDIVKRTTTVNGETIITKYTCKSYTNAATFDTSKWFDEGQKMNYVEIVGNGRSTFPSNARTLDWNGNEWILGNLDIGGSFSMDRKTGTTIGLKSVAEGQQTTANGNFSHAEGNGTIANGYASHAEGTNTKANAYSSHAEGEQTLANGNRAHAEGAGTQSSGNASHAEGVYTQAIGEGAHAEGLYTYAGKEGSHTEGSNTSVTELGINGHAEGYFTSVTGQAAHAEGGYTIASGDYSHVVGKYNIEDNNDNYSNWTSDTLYHVGDIVKASITNAQSTTVNKYICKEEHTSGSIFESDANKWSNHLNELNYVEIVGNGLSDNERSNARTLDWDGNEVISNSITVGQRQSQSPIGEYSIAIGNNNIASGYSSSAHGEATNASGYAAYAEGRSTVASGRASHAEGGGTQATNEYSHTEGGGTQATGVGSHAEGGGTIASGVYSHAEGSGAQAIGDYSHAEGAACQAIGHESHAEGLYSVASDDCSHAEGQYTIASGKYSHVFGRYNIEDSYDNIPNFSASTDYQIGDVIKQATVNNEVTTYDIYKCKTAHTSGIYMDYSKWDKLADRMKYIEIVGNGTGHYIRSNARTLDWEGNETIARSLTVGTRNSPGYVGQNSFASGSGCTASGNQSHAEGGGTTASNTNAHAEGTGSTASGEGSHAEGGGTQASGDWSHAECGGTRATGASSHAEGSGSTASAQAAHAEGGGTTASAQNAHAEGGVTVASAPNAHAEGSNTTASGNGSHAEGISTYASGDSSHAEGIATQAQGDASHTEGIAAIASGACSHAQGQATIAAGAHSMVLGRYNIQDSYDNWQEWVSGTSYNVGDKVKITTVVNDVTTITGYICLIANNDNSFTANKWSNQYGKMNYAEIVGNGDDSNNRSNMRTLDWNGNEELAGDLIIKKGTADEVSVSSLKTAVNSKIDDVQVNGTSIVANGVANVPVAGSDTFGVGKSNSTYGVGISHAAGDVWFINKATTAEAKAGTNAYKPIVPAEQHSATFYGLSKAAGIDLASETVTVGTYPASSQTAIRSMIGAYAKPSTGIPASDLAPGVIPETEAYYISKALFTNPTTVNSNASSVINSAIQAAHTAGKQYCVIPDGEYWLTETIYLADSVILCGSGIDATTLKIADGSDIDAIRVRGPINNSGIMDLAIDGNRIANYSVYYNGHHGNAINVWLHYGRIERVRTNWVYKHSLMLNYDTGSGDDGLGFAPEHQNDMGNLNKVLWCDFRDSLLQGVMWGWRTMDSWMCYTNIGSHAANLYLEGGTSRFIGNHFDGDGDNGAGPEYNVYCGDGCTAMLFSENIFENTQKENIYFRQPSYRNGTKTITITNNIIRTCSKTTNNTYANIKISGYDSDTKAEQITITGNQILNPDTNANHGYAGIHLDYCKDVKINGNVYFNVGADNVIIENTCENVMNDDDFGSVKDVQLNGTSVITDGVANVPVAGAGNESTSTLGVVRGGKGVKIANDGRLFIDQAYASDIKSGTSAYLPIVAKTVDIATFYGLAKAAGDTTQSSSSNAVGTFTPEAKAAIWNMLGLDGSAFVSSEWEVIREDTVTNETEADIEITVDGDGNAFELTDAYLAIEIPSQEEQASVGTYGKVSFKGGNTEIINAYLDAVTVSAGTKKYALAKITQDNGMIEAKYCTYASSNVNNQWKSHSSVPDDNTGSPFRLKTDLIKNIIIKSVTGTMNYWLYGKRKRTALDSPVINVSGSTPSITALPGHRYICGEVSTLAITVPTSGCVDVVFESGSTATVLTTTPTKTGVSAIKWANGFDPSSLDADTRYEVLIDDGEYGMVAIWT